MKTHFDSVDINTSVFQYLSAVNIIPWKFGPAGKSVLGRIPTLRWAMWVLTFSTCTLYAFYVDVTLVHMALHGMRQTEYYQLGAHILQALLTSTFSYWAFELFLRFSGNHKLLYNFTQTSPGEFWFLLILRKIDNATWNCVNLKHFGTDVSTDCEGAPSKKELWPCPLLCRIHIAPCLQHISCSIQRPVSLRTRFSRKKRNPAGL